MGILRIRTILTNTTNSGNRQGVPLFLSCIPPYGIKLKHPGSTEVIEGHLESRMPDAALRSLQSIIQRGDLRLGHVQVLPDGSTVPLDAEGGMPVTPVDVPVTAPVVEAQPVKRSPEMFERARKKVAQRKAALAAEAIEVVSLPPVRTAPRRSFIDVVATVSPELPVKESAPVAKPATIIKTVRIEEGSLDQRTLDI